MTRRYDLHSHSHHSDGTLSPTDLIREAQAAGIDVLALTDHDVTDGLHEARAVAATVGITLVDGVEISATWQRTTIHIVGLAIDSSHAGLQAGLARLRDIRNARAVEIGKRLAKHRVPGAFEGAAQLAKGAIVSRTHFARHLVSRGVVLSVGDAFRHYLGKHGPGYVPGEWASLSEVIGWIKAAGGVAVVAHPARYKLSNGRLRALLGEFKEAGGDGLEVLSGMQSRDVTDHLIRLGREFDLMASMGSDYHGPSTDGLQWNTLGRLARLPEGLPPVWQSWAPAG